MKSWLVTIIHWLFQLFIVCKSSGWPRLPHRLGLCHTTSQAKWAHGMRERCRNATWFWNCDRMWVEIMLQKSSIFWHALPCFIWGLPHVSSIAGRDGQWRALRSCAAEPVLRKGVVLGFLGSLHRAQIGMKGCLQKVAARYVFDMSLISLC